MLDASWTNRCMDRCLRFNEFHFHAPIDAVGESESGILELKVVSKEGHEGPEGKMFLDNEVGAHEKHEEDENGLDGKDVVAFERLFKQTDPFLSVFKVDHLLLRPAGTEGVIDLWLSIILPRAERKKLFCLDSLIERLPDGLVPHNPIWDLVLFRINRSIHPKAQ